MKNIRLSIYITFFLVTGLYNVTYTVITKKNSVRSISSGRFDEITLTFVIISD